MVDFKFTEGIINKSEKYIEALQFATLSERIKNLFLDAKYVSCSFETPDTFVDRVWEIKYTNSDIMDADSYITVWVEECRYDGSFKLYGDIHDNKYNIDFMFDFFKYICEN